MTERLTNANHSRIVSITLFTMTACVVFMAAYVILAIFTGNPEADRINDKLDKQLELLDQQVSDARQSGRANACTAYHNHLAIEQALRDIAELNGIKTGEPRVRATAETLDACRAIGVPVDTNGVPNLDNSIAPSAH